MHTVIESPTVLADCQKAGVSDKDRGMMVSAISNDPKKGDVMPGTGGARKLRFAGRGKGKSGGYRTVHFYAAADVPALMLALIDKGERADLSQAERNELRKELSGYAADYRASVKTKVSVRKRGKT